MRSLLSFILRYRPQLLIGTAIVSIAVSFTALTAPDKVVWLIALPGVIQVTALVTVLVACTALYEAIIEIRLRREMATRIAAQAVIDHVGNDDEPPPWAPV